MTEERVTETTDASGNTHTRTTIIRDGEGRRSGGGARWVFLLIIVLVAAAVVYLVSQGTGAEIAKDNAIAGAAEKVGDGAEQVGDAAQEAVDKIDGE